MNFSLKNPLHMMIIPVLSMSCNGKTHCNSTLFTTDKSFFTGWKLYLLPNWVFHDTHFCQIIWQMWSYTAQNKFHQKMPLVGFELTTSRSSVWYSDNWASKESVGDFWSELSFVSWITSHVGLCLFLESIEHNFIKALTIHTDNQIVT